MDHFSGDAKETIRSTSLLCNKGPPVARSFRLEDFMSTVNTTIITGTLEIDAPSGDVVVHNTTSDPSADGFYYKLIYQAAARNQGPPSEPTYTDNVWAWGINIGDAPGAKANASKAYGAWHLESKFYQGPSDPPSPLMEHFFTFININNVTIRPIAWTSRWDSSYSDIVLAAHLINFTTQGGQPRITFDFQTANQISLWNGLAQVFETNNVPIVLQERADGTAAYNLPYLDSNDNFSVSRPFTGVGGGGVTVTTGAGSANTVPLVANAPSANAASIQVSCQSSSSAKTGSFGVDAAGNVVFRQESNGGAMFFDYNGTINFRDKNASFKTTITITEQRAALGVPLQVPSYTVASLPSASNAGAGAIVYVTNAAGGPTLAGSDGTNWRIIATLGSVVS
jgi:hypothetical protein